MAYKFNPITGKMDMVNSAAEISDSVAISGETFEKHGNLQPQVLDNKPVSEVLSGILFRDYPPTIKTSLSSKYAFVGESVIIARPQQSIVHTVGKRTNSLANLTLKRISGLVYNNYDNYQSEELLSHDFTAAEKDLKTQTVNYAPDADLALLANTTIYPKVTDDAGLFSFTDEDGHSAVRYAVFTYPIIVGAYNNNNLSKIVINKNGLVYNLSVFDDNGNNITNACVVSPYKYGGSGTINCTINLNDIITKACVIARTGTFKTFVQKGTTDTVITLQKIKNVTVDFQIEGVSKWPQATQEDFELYATTEPFVKPYTAAVTFEPKY